MAARYTPDTLGLLLVLAVAVTWATYTGTLPGRFFGVLGVGLQITFWMLLYRGLVSVYGTLALGTNDSARMLLRGVGLSLALAVFSTHLCKIVVESLVGPGMWHELFYFRLVLPPAFIGLWCTVLLPRATRNLYSAAKARLSPLPELAVLFTVSALLLSITDFAFEWLGGSAVDVRLKSEVVQWNAWITNVLILFSALAVVFAAARKVITALLVVTPVYVVFAFATLEKIEYMHSAVQPLDLIRVLEFLPLFHSFFGTGALIAAAVTLALWMVALLASHRMTPSPLAGNWRAIIAIVPLVVLLGLPAAFALATSHPKVSALLLRLGGPDSEHREKARRNGLLLSFIAEIPATFVVAPPNYSAATVQAALAKYQRTSGSTTGIVSGHGVSLIIYLVESLMDPDDLGFHYTADPIPTLRGLRKTHLSGYALVPERFGGSANTEFELLTGMTRSFLPEGSVPYRQYLRHSVLSLPCLLNRLGYTTTAIQADPKYYYDRERVYDLLGFKRTIWLRDAPGIERAPRGPWPSDQSVVDAVIQASRGTRPFFVFAFPSSTHSPYNFGAYQNSDLNLLDPPLGYKGAEVNEYVNAVRDADRAIGTLIEHFRRERDSTIIAILGDHVPPLSTQALQPFFSTLTGLPKAEQARRLHRVPLLVWANFEFPREEVELSTNDLPSLLLEKMRIQAPGFLAVTDTVRRKVPALATYLQGADGRLWDGDSAQTEQRGLVEDYRLLQYDLLLGKQYAFREGVQEWCLSPK